MHPIVWNLKNKLNWMSNHLRWINEDSEIIKWMQAMKMVNDMLVDVVNSSDIGQVWIKSRTVRAPSDG